MSEFLDTWQIGWVHCFGHELVAAQDKAPSLAGDVAQRSLPRIARVGGRSEIEFDTLAIQDSASKRHVVFPADQPADFADVGTEYGQRAAITFTPD